MHDQVPQPPVAEVDAGSTHGTKRKEMEEVHGETTGPALPRKRASRACDHCKLKRWKCEGKSDTDETCSACRSGDIPCTYIQPARKRGPAVGFRDRQREEQEQRELRRAGPAGSADDSRQASAPISEGEGSDGLAGSTLGVEAQAAGPLGDGRGIDHDAALGRQDVPVGEKQTLGQAQRPGLSQRSNAAAAATAGADPSRSPNAHHHAARAPPRTAMPLLGLPRAMVDGLLGVYFTHVHNVWPLIYKSSFSPHSTSPLLLLSMLAISACIAPPSPVYGYDAAKLYRMAESALHQRRDNGIDIIQAVVLLSLRQTGCGDKGSAFIYAGRACAMVLNSGLNLARRDVSPDSVRHPTRDAGWSDVMYSLDRKLTEQPEEQTRSRVFWNCYVLDKTLAEETGRSFLLPYRRCSTPFPSVTEIDELESWPPASFSSAPLPRSVRGIVPRRGYVVSCFVWTCRLAKVVEDILDLEFVEAAAEDEWDRQFRESGEAKRGLLSEAQEAERISEQLKLWGEMLPRHLRIEGTVSPLPHHAISLAWHTTSTIMLHSRYVSKIPRALPQPTSPVGDNGSEVVVDSHDICSAAAASTVDMMRLLDKHGLMEQLSSDIIHILSLVTLFLAFDSTSPDHAIATRAKADFQQSCTWLRALTDSWPAASAHKLFFEAVIQGGMKLADTEAGYADRASPLTSTTAVSPGLSGGLQAVRRHLSVSTASASKPLLPMQVQSNLRKGLGKGALGQGTGDGAEVAGGMEIMGTANGGGAGGMMLLPHIYWNQLSTAGATTQNPLLGLDLDHEYGLNSTMRLGGNSGGSGIGMDMNMFDMSGAGAGLGGTASMGMVGSGNGNAGFDDFSFGLSSYSQNLPGQQSSGSAQQAQPSRHSQSQHQQAAPSIPARPAGESSSFAAVSPVTGTNPSLPWLDESGNNRARGYKPDGQGVRASQPGGDTQMGDPWLSPSDQWASFNFSTDTGAGRVGLTTREQTSTENDLNAFMNLGPQMQTQTQTAADLGYGSQTTGQRSGEGMSGDMLKQDQSAITAALMKFMADMRNTGGSGSTGRG